MSLLVTKVVQEFKTKFSSMPEIIAGAPGRVNIIGEHTDYSGGYVLPVAIDREVVFAASKAERGFIVGYSVDYNECAAIKAGEYDPSHPYGWLRYVMGVLEELEKAGKTISGFNFAVGGNVPIGSGLSSSAALEMAVCKAMEGLFRFNLSDKEAASLTQRAENSFVGVNCGIMDQYISRVGRTDHAAKIDCADLSIKMTPVNTPGYSWLIIDSKKRRGLVDSEYNKRRKECEKGVLAARSIFKNRKIDSLRDLSLKDLDKLGKSCEQDVFKRIKHVVTENSRVLETAKALERGDVETIGKNLYASHASLRDDFEVSCEELDMLVSLLSDVPGVAGARLTGAGFGGCVIALVKDSAVKDASNAITKNYYPPDSKEGEPDIIQQITISDGARFIKLDALSLCEIK